MPARRSSGFDTLKPLAEKLKEVPPGTVQRWRTVPESVNPLGAIFIDKDGNPESKEMTPAVMIEYGKQKAQKDRGEEVKPSPGHPLYERDMSDVATMPKASADISSGLDRVDSRKSLEELKAMHGHYEEFVTQNQRGETKKIPFWKKEENALLVRSRGDRAPVNVAVNEEITMYGKRFKNVDGALVEQAAEPAVAGAAEAEAAPRLRDERSDARVERAAQESVAIFDRFYSKARTHEERMRTTEVAFIAAIARRGDAVVQRVIGHISRRGGDNPRAVVLQSIYEHYKAGTLPPAPARGIEAAPVAPVAREEREPREESLGTARSNEEIEANIAKLRARLKSLGEDE